MFRSFILYLLVLSRIAVSETSSNDSHNLQVEHVNPKESLSAIEPSDLLNERNELKTFPNIGESILSQVFKTEDESLHISNNSSVLPDPGIAKNDVTITDRDDFSSSDNSYNNRNIQIEDQSNNEFDENVTQKPDSFSPINDIDNMDIHFVSDYLLQMNVSNGYDPKRTEKNKLLHKEDELVDHSQLKSTKNFVNPTIGPISKTEKSSLMKRVDNLLERNMENSYNIAGDLKENGLLVLADHSINQSGLPSKPRFLDHDLSTISHLTDLNKDAIDYVSIYRPNTNQLQIYLDEGNGKNELHQLKPSRDQEIQKFGEPITTKVEDDHPDSLSEAEDTRKVTILKQKTVHSVSKEEEQETVNIQKTAEERSSEDDIIAIETKSSKNDLPKPEKQEKIEKREETIVLVEGKHIPGKNYGPENDLFGYYADSYDNFQPESKQNLHLKTVLSNGPSLKTSQKLRNNNHGDGFSTRYFESFPKSSDISDFSRFKDNDKFVFPPSKSPPRITHERLAPSGTEEDKSLNLPESYGKSNTNAKYQENDNIVPVTGNAQGSEHQGEDQYELVDVDPNQIYMDEKTGQLIKFVTEEEAKKLGITSHHQVQDGQDGHSVTYSEKRPEQNFQYGGVEDFKASLVPKEPGINFKTFVSDGGNKKYADLTNADLKSNSPLIRPRRGKITQSVTDNRKNSQFNIPVKDAIPKRYLNSVLNERNHGVQEDKDNYGLSGHRAITNSKLPQLVAINGKSAQFHVPAKDITAKSNFQTVSYEGSHGVQEDQGSYKGPSGGIDEAEYVVLSPEIDDNGQNNQNYGKKTNFDSLRDTVVVPESIKDNNHNNFKGSIGTIVGYEDNSGYKTSNDGLNNSENKDIYIDDNFETHGGKLENVGNFKRSNGLFNTADHGQLIYNSQTSGESEKPQNIGNFKGSSGGLDDAQGHGILYELQADVKSNKADDSELPLYKENMHLYRKDTESSLSNIPSKGDAVSTVYFTMIHHKTKNSRNPKIKKQNQNYNKFTNYQSKFKGFNQKQNGGLGINSIHDNENFKISLQNLYGSNGGSYGKTEGSNFQNSGPSKKNNGYVVPTGINFKGEQLYEEVNLSPSQGSIKGSSENSNGNNLKGQQLYEEVTFNPPQGSFKGSSENYNANNLKGQQLYEEVTFNPPQSSFKGSSENYNGNNLKGQQLYEEVTFNPSQGALKGSSENYKGNNLKGQQLYEEVTFNPPQGSFKGSSENYKGNNLKGQQLYEEVTFNPPQGSFKGSSENYNGNNLKGQQLYEEVTINPSRGSSKGSSESYNQNNFKGQQLKEKVKISLPKGSSEIYNGYNIKSGINFQGSRNPSGDYFSGLSGSANGKHGGYKSNGLTYISQNGNLQNSYQTLQDQLSGLNNVYQSEGPVEYVIVEEDDNNHESKGIRNVPYILGENYYKGHNMGSSPIGGSKHQPYVVKGSTTYSMDPNVRLLVDGGKDTDYRLRRLAATGFHMARGVLPYIPLAGPRSIKGNVNFGLQINKRRGPTIISHYI